MTQPLCDICEIDGLKVEDRKSAKYDAKSLIGPWAYMCAEHFILWGDKTPGFSTVLKSWKENNNG